VFYVRQVVGVYSVLRCGLKLCTYIYKPIGASPKVRDDGRVYSVTRNYTLLVAARAIPDVKFPTKLYR
jgi:hypothetical protein